ncbi:MAG: PASTA domain-containing protein [Acutalibacteraceae bacterium]|nr:PASTA domain-containing protein [Acutalibacteraceae bacterium]
MVNTDRLCMGCMNDNGGEKICPICGYDVSQDNDPQYLPVGTWLAANRYLVGRVTEECGDGVTYIAWDNDQNAVVNIKEFFPAGVAVRSTNRITVIPAENRGLEFTRGREEFVSLFSQLAKMPESTAILRVVDNFEAGGTVYSVSNTVSGTSLKAFLIRHGGALKWEQVKPLFMPLIDSVAQLNEAGILHRGISPDNIIVGRDGKLRLSGFCIKGARVQHSEYLSQLATGYAAPEQYLENESTSRSCDVYAIGAILFRCLIGTTPPDAKDRLLNDKLSIPAKVTDTVPRKLLVAIANALKVDKNERISSASLLYSALETIPTTPMVPPETVTSSAEETKKSSSGIKYVIISILVTAFVFIVGITVAWFAFDLGDALMPESKPITNSSSQPSSEESSSNQGYAPGTVLFEVPDLLGKVYSEIYGELQTEYSHFEFEVAGRVASDTVPKGSICQQSIAGGTKAERKALIKIYISQGPDKVFMPNILGSTVAEAKSLLFDAGFYSDTIIVRKGFDINAAAGSVYKVTYGESDSEVVVGSKISVNELIVIYYRDPDTVTTPDLPTDDTIPDPIA